MVQNLSELRNKIFEIKSEADFESAALSVFQIQSELCKPYKEYLQLIGVNPADVTHSAQIPSLPVSLFKNTRVICTEATPEHCFTSSTTTGATPSVHYVADLSLYRESFLRSFNLFLGSPEEYVILALLPSYLEREGSSLVYMVQELIKQSADPLSGFYLYNHQQLKERLVTLAQRNKKTILLGVSFALLDFAESCSISFPSLTVIETGGMKGRKTEIPREQLHATLQQSFGVNRIGSEYGMTELLSQGWSLSNGIYNSPPWMKINIRDLGNPFKLIDNNKKGGINIIDLANLYSCSFIETEDIGIKTAENSFKVLGRINNSEIRGCNLLLEG